MRMCGRKLINEHCRHNTEKVIYFLLLDRKMRQPSHDDVEDAKQRSRSGSRQC